MTVRDRKDPARSGQGAGIGEGLVLVHRTGSRSREQRIEQLRGMGTA